MSLKVRKTNSQQVWLNKDSTQLSNSSTPSDQHLVDRVKIVERPLSQTELDENFEYLEETKQPLDTDLTSIATLTTSPSDRSYGFITRRAEGDVRTRTLIGENNPLTGATRIVIDDGAGINQDPVIHIGSDIVTLNDSQTLTNKTIDARYNNILYVDADMLDGYHLNQIPLLSVSGNQYVYHVSSVDGASWSIDSAELQDQGSALVVSINGVQYWTYGFRVSSGMAGIKLCSCTCTCPCQNPCACPCTNTNRCYVN